MRVASALARAGLDRSLMGADHRSRDGEPEAGAGGFAAKAVVTAIKWFEDADGGRRDRDPDPVVLDLEHDLVIAVEARTAICLSSPVYL